MLAALSCIEASLAEWLRYWFAALNHQAKWLNQTYPDLLQVGASIATVVGALSLFAAAWSIVSDWRRRKKEWGELRKTRLAALRVEALGVHVAVDDDIERFEEYPKRQAFTPEQTLEHQRVFIWRPLPSATIEQAAGEPFLLSLSPDQIVDLLVLRSGIQKFNTFVNAKIAVIGARTTNKSNASSKC